MKNNVHKGYVIDRVNDYFLVTDGYESYQVPHPSVEEARAFIDRGAEHMLSESQRRTSEAIQKTNARGRTSILYSLHTWSQPVYHDQIDVKFSCGHVAKSTPWLSRPGPLTDEQIASHREWKGRSPCPACCKSHAETQANKVAEYNAKKMALAREVAKAMNKAGMKARVDQYSRITHKAVTAKVVLGVEIDAIGSESVNANHRSRTFIRFADGKINVRPIVELLDLAIEDAQRAEEARQVQIAEDNAREVLLQTIATAAEGIAGLYLSVENVKRLKAILDDHMHECDVDGGD